MWTHIGITNHDQLEDWGLQLSRLQTGKQTLGFQCSYALTIGEHCSLHWVAMGQARVGVACPLVAKWLKETYFTGVKMHFTFFIIYFSFADLKK